MRTSNDNLEVVSIYEGYEEAFWNHVNRDPLDYFFFRLDLKQNPESTKILLAIERERIQGLMLVYSDIIVQLRGTRRAVEELLNRVNLEKIELQAPLDCEDIVTGKYDPQIRHELVLMTLKKGDEKIRIKQNPVRLGPENASEVAELMKEADPEWWSGITPEDRRQSLVETYWVGLKDNGRIVSIGNTRFTDLGSNIGVVATDERYRNRGYATSIVSTLVEESLKRSPTTLIHVLSENAPAIRVYSNVGYRPYKRYLLMRAERIKK
jgi:ribosomal protein S18 acetylase RimI-like enzyme